MPGSAEENDTRIYIYIYIMHIHKCSAPAIVASMLRLYLYYLYYHNRLIHLPKLRRRNCPKKIVYICDFLDFFSYKAFLLEKCSLILFILDTAILKFEISNQLIRTLYPNKIIGDNV